MSRGLILCYGHAYDPSSTIGPKAELRPLPSYLPPGVIWTYIDKTPASLPDIVLDLNNSDLVLKTLGQERYEYVFIHTCITFDISELINLLRTIKFLLKPGGYVIYPNGFRRFIHAYYYGKPNIDLETTLNTFLKAYNSDDPNYRTMILSLLQELQTMTGYQRTTFYEPIMGKRLGVLLLFK